MDFEASSSSSDVWSDSDAESGQGGQDDVEEANAHVAQAPKPVVRGEKKPFQAPLGYEPARFSDGVLSTFGSDSFGRGSRKQLWCIKIPEGMSPALLNGLKVHLPQSVLAQSSTSPLTHLAFERKVKGEGNAVFTQNFSLRNRRTRPKAARKGDQSGMTQLIAMAGGSDTLREGEEEEEEEEEEGGHGNEEMEALQVLLPDPSRPGKYVCAPVPMKHHLQFVLDAPFKADSTSSNRAADEARKAKGEKDVGSAEAATSAGAKGRRSQPWDRMKGFFHPAGSSSSSGIGLALNDRMDERGVKKREATETKAEEVDVKSESPTKKSKTSKEKHSSPEKKKKRTSH